MKLATILGACLAVGLAVAAACSSDNKATNPGGGGLGGGGNPDASANGGFGNTGGAAITCKPGGIACTTDAECCGAVCDPATNQCSTTGIGACLGADVACADATQCCSFACLSGKCSGSQCKADNTACAVDGECCGGTCTNKLCAPLNPVCKTSGNPCAANGECCSKFCKSGTCNAYPSYCRIVGDTCTDDLACCGGNCVKATGATLGVCALVSAPGATNCLSAGEVCSGGLTAGAGGAGGAAGVPTCGGECCSRACFPYGPTGVLICQPPSGCHPTGEICQEDSDCCGGESRPDGTQTQVKCSKEAGQTVGRCDNGLVCSPAGNICKLATTSCNATDRCCAGTVQVNPWVCKQDNLGIPRCMAADVDCTDTAALVGKACASSADCCNLPCVPNPAGTPPFVCGDACVPAGGSCTTTADCCPGLPCTIPTGSAVGVCGAPPSDAGVPPPDAGIGCADYGQQCTTASDCCNGVPCTTSEVGSFCVYPLR